MAITKIPEELKLNKFEYAVIPHARDLVGLHGYAVTPANQYTGEETALMPTDKVHELQRGAQIIKEEYNKKEK